MDIVLVAGLWLDASAWDKTVTALEGMGHRAHPVSLPGQGDGAQVATLDEQLEAVVAVVDRTPTPPMVVGHSASCSLAWMAADARPERIAKVSLIGAFPWADGQPYADFIPPTNGFLVFPGWENFEERDKADMDDDMRRDMAENAIPVPEGVTKASVHYADERRFDVPALVVCPEFSVEDARAWIEAGDVPEMAGVKNLDLVDLASGHWPMISAPVELAKVLDEASKL